jgi:S-adenosylmethionine-diacylgycerolhomoserine-N-methlytransferase
MSQIGIHAAPERAAAQMDGIYRYQRFIYDATRRYYLLGRDRLLTNLDVPKGGSVLEIGCGTARNLIKAARLYPGARFYGLDVSEEMLRTARGKIERAGMADCIEVAAGDATAFSAAELFGRPAFDRVFISYALSMIPPWRDAVACAADSVAPGGVLHVVDFGDFAGYPEWMRRAQFGWLGRFSVLPIASLDRRLAEVGRKKGFAASSRRFYGGYAMVASLTRT